MVGGEWGKLMTFKKMDESFIFRVQMEELKIEIHKLL